MADAEYRRLSCGVCGGGFLQYPKGRVAKFCTDHRGYIKKGRNAEKRRHLKMPVACSHDGCGSAAKSLGYCIKHYQRLRAHGSTGPREQTCSFCGGKFTCERTRKYCSSKCNSTAHNRRSGYRPLEEHLLAIRSEANYLYCETCGKESHRGLGGRSIKGGYRNRFCSIVCRRQMAARLRSEVQFLRALARSHKNTEQERLRLERMARVAMPRMIQCRHCGKQAMPYKKYARFCSEACRTAVLKEHARLQRKSAAGRARKKREKTLRRAREKIVADLIDPIKVFERDGWRCHICRKKLKPEDRGTNKAGAPELEHIIAIADGGTHTWGNVACACRACNGSKGARSFGQLRFDIAA